MSRHERSTVLRQRLLWSISTMALLCSLPALAQDVEAEFVLGWRFVDVSGAEGKYKQHINLDDGPRLFGLDLEFRPESPLLDLAEIRADQLGGDPNEHFEVRLRKYDAYNLSFSRTTSEFFYEDLLLPESLVNPRLSNGGDFHTFDFQRVRDHAQLGVEIGRRSRFDLTFDRNQREGDSTTVFDVSRDEFELDQPLDETHDAISLAWQTRWKKNTLTLEETVRRSENTRTVFLPGRSEGENPGPAILDLYFLDEAIDLDSNQHTVRFTSRPTRDLIIESMLWIDDAELTSSAHERAAGVSFSGGPLAIDERGDIDIERETLQLDVDLSWRLSPRIALLGGLRHRDLEQEAHSTFEGVTRTEWDLQTRTAELGLEIAPHADWTFGGGLVQESRDVDEHGSSSLPIETDHTGFFLRATWKPIQTLQVKLRAESSDVDDPYTLASPTERQRTSLFVSWRNNRGAFLRGQWLDQQVDNDNSAWTSDSQSWSLRGGLRHRSLHASFGLGVVDVDRRIDQIVTTVGFGGGAQFLFPVDFRADSEFFDARVRWQPDTAWQLFADARRFENDGSFAMRRDDLRVGVEFDLRAPLFARLSARTIEYEELRFGLNDYEADLVELGIGYRLGRAAQP